MNQAAVAPKPKKSVALSGVTAGNTALCTVGRTGNDLHYRGYDILEIATACEFEEIAYLLIHEKLPNVRELAAYREKLVGLRGLPPQLARSLEDLPAAAHRWTCCAPASRCSGAWPGSRGAAGAGARDIADRLIASSAPCSATGTTSATSGAASRSRPTTTRSAGTSCTCCTAARPPAEWVRAMHTSLILYAEHEFNASTFTARVIAGTGSDLYSCITGAIGALRGPKHGGANEVAFEIQNRYRTPDEAEADIRARVAAKEVIIGFGHPVYTIADPRNDVIKEVSRGLAHEAAGSEPVRDRRAHRGGDEATPRTCSRTSTGSRRCRTT